MTRYFIAANLWLMFAVIVFLGRAPERHEPVRYSFFHAGYWFSPEAYALIIAVLLAASAAFFALTWKTRDRSCQGR